MPQTLTGGAQTLNGGSTLVSSPAQTANDKKIATMENIAALPFTKEYVSPEQVITSAGQLSLTHALGVVPKLVTTEIVCKVAELGFAVGDIVQVPAAQQSSSVADNHGFVIITGTSTLTIRYGSNPTVFSTLNAISGVGVNPANASWRLVVRAWA